MNTTQLILQYGGFGVIAVFFAITLRWLLHDFKNSLDNVTRELKQVTGDFNTTVINHLIHSEEAHKAETEMLGDMADAVKELCRMWGINK